GGSYVGGLVCVHIVGQCAVHIKQQCAIRSRYLSKFVEFIAIFHIQYGAKIKILNVMYSPCYRYLQTSTYYPIEFSILVLKCRITLYRSEERRVGKESGY